MDLREYLERLWISTLYLLRMLLYSALVLGCIAVIIGFVLALMHWPLIVLAVVFITAFLLSPFLPRDNDDSGDFPV